MRSQIAERAQYRCEYCGAPDSFTSDIFEVDHIRPQSKEGNSDFENFAWACGGCNSFKAAKSEGTDPATLKETSLFHPRKDKWSDHFIWSADTLEIIGISDVGRATVVASKNESEFTCEFAAGIGFCR